MSDINITFGGVSQTAATIRSLNQRLQNTLLSVKQEMNALESSWQSDASTTIRQKFNALDSKFENYYQIVDSYAQFLDKTVQAYNEAETTINSNANMFK